MIKNAINDVEKNKSTQGVFTFLGTGASAGVPVIGCKCAVCLSDNPKNKRLRSSALIRINNKSLLIDAGPDIRMQALKYGIHYLDGVLITHTHYDHIGGLEELRAYNFFQKMALPCLVSKRTYTDIQKLYYYHFEKKGDGVNHTAHFTYEALEEKRGTYSFCDVPLSFFQYEQVHMPVLGFRFGSLAYVTDIKNYPETIFEDLQNVHTLIISALTKKHSRIQFTIDEAQDFIQKVQPTRAFLNHLSHDIDHSSTELELPDYIQLAYDGLELEFSI